MKAHIPYLGLFWLAVPWRSTGFSPRGQPSGSPWQSKRKGFQGRESKGWGYIQGTVLRLNGKDYRPGQSNAGLLHFSHLTPSARFPPHMTPPCGDINNKGAWPSPQLLSSQPSCNQTSQAQLQSSHWPRLWQEPQGPDRCRDLNFLFPLHKEIVARINTVSSISPETITRMGDPGSRKIQTLNNERSKMCAYFSFKLVTKQWLELRL